MFVFFSRISIEIVPLTILMLSIIRTKKFCNSEITFGRKKWKNNKTWQNNETIKLLLFTTQFLTPIFGPILYLKTWAIEEKLNKQNKLSIFPYRCGNFIAIIL